MPEPNLFFIFTNRLDQMDLCYMVTGAVASILYGEPRLTHDIDLVVEITDESVNEIVQAFPSDQFYCPPVEIIRLEITRPLRGHFNLIHHATGFKADVYLMGQDDLHRWAMPKRKRIQLESTSVWVAPPEYVILRKLEYYRDGKSEKHLRDIAGMMGLSSEQIDTQVLENKVKDLSLEKEWKEAQRIISEL